MAESGGVTTCWETRGVQGGEEWVCKGGGERAALCAVWRPYHGLLHEQLAGAGDSSGLGSQRVSSYSG